MTAPAAPVDRLSAEPDRRHALRRAWPLLRPHRGPLAAAAATTLLVSGARLAGPVLVGVAVDAVLDRDDGRVAAAAVAYGAIALTVLVLQRARLRLAARAGEGFLADLRDTTARRVLGRPLAFFDRHPTGQLVSRCTTDVDALAQFVREGLPGLVDAVLLLVATAVVLVAASWQLTLLALVYVPLLVVAARRYRRAADPAYAAEADALAATTTAIGETLEARSFLQGVGATDAWAARLREVDRGLLDTNAVTLRAENRLSVVGLWQLVTLALVLLVGGTLVDQGTVTVGVVATFALALRQLFDPLDSLSWLYGDAQAASANLARVLELLAGPDPGPIATPEAELGGDGGGLAVDLDGVAYAYDDGPPALVAVDLHVAAGERVAVVGPTGAGKSTVGKLVVGLLEPGAGTVRVGGRLVADWAPHHLRAAAVLLPQEGHLVAGTLGDNLRLVPGCHTDADLLAAVDAAGLRPWLDRLPDGLATRVGDRGADLSAGERQLVALVRAALADPALLVLDEATADVDPVTEGLVNDALDRLTAGRTVLVIAHRPATAARCDRIVQLVAGHSVAGPGREHLG